MGFKPQAEGFEHLKGCPTCRAPIHGVLRYGRIVNKRMVRGQAVHMLISSLLRL